LRGHTDVVRDVAISPDGTQLVSGGYDNVVRLWDVATRGARELGGNQVGVKEVAWSPDGKLVASAGVDTTVRVWSSQTGAPVRVLRGHSAAAKSVAFSPDSQVLASASDDDTVRWWELGAPPPPEEVAELPAWLEAATNLTLPGTDTPR
ncbi:MAG TPA: hypothetical protein VFX50_12660, partial [Gemmatimonadales bacterium]|nr:hypothetical protein [Gemmatimonadales bacterium]